MHCSIICHSYSAVQKAVRVTTLMKRLRAPEQAASAAANPTAEALTTPVPQSGLLTSPAVAPGSTPDSTETPTTNKDTESKPDSVGVIKAPDSAPQVGNSSSLSNGEAPAPEQTSSEARDEQNG